MVDSSRMPGQRGVIRTLVLLAAVGVVYVCCQKFSRSLPVACRVPSVHPVTAGLLAPRGNACLVVDPQTATGVVSTTCVTLEQRNRRAAPAVRPVRVVDIRESASRT